MGSIKDDKWLEAFKGSLQNHSEQLPESFWKQLQKDIPLQEPVKVHRTGRWTGLAASAAAVLAIPLLLLWNQEDELQFPEKSISQAAVPEMAVQQEGIHREHLLEEVGCMEAECKEAERDESVTERKVLLKPAIEKSVAEGTVVEEPSIEEPALAEIVSEPADGEKSGDAGKLEQEREEYLRELEYLLNGDKGKRTERKKWIALAAGRSGRMIEFGECSHIFLNNNDLMDGRIFGNMVNLSHPSISNSNVGWVGSKIPNFANGINRKNIPLKYEHKMPVKGGISFAVQINGRLYAEGGILYQYLQSTIIGRGEQSLHYIGIPVKMSCHFVQERAFSVYLSGGFMLEKCVWGDISWSDGSREKLKIAGVEPSLSLTLGLQLRLWGNAALYLEPGVHHYFGMDDGGALAIHNGYIIQSMYSEDPFGLSLQGGIKFSF